MRLREIHIRVGLFAVSLLAMLLGSHLLLMNHAPSVFNDTLEDMSYGWYVPVFSLYVVWSERRKIMESVGDPSLWGLLLIIPFAFAGLYISCTFGRIRALPLPVVLSVMESCSDEITPLI